MKKTVHLSLLLAASICYAVPAQATSACFCVGPSRTAGTCGNGGIGASFQTVHKSISDTLINRLLLTQALRDTLASSGKAYDSTSGWACWKE